ncbi:MAG: hypothetical protein LKI58_07200 [Actinomyces sp.]|jgi:hypothetical protein|nr:hypothetical protein [Actinomyces sp.]MCI1787836.1 hypothetical protein [Actinomyces sp.]MCI1829828.1 hypothetical protein [Actinomyces sp.]
MNDIPEFSAVAGSIAALLGAVINQSHWSSRTKRMVSAAVAVVVAGVGVVSVFRPDTWTTVATAALATVGAAQVVYTAFAPVFRGIEQATTRSEKQEGEPD